MINNILETLNGKVMYTLDYQRQVVKLLCINLQFFNHYNSIIKSDYFELQPTRTILEILTKHILTYEKELDENDLVVKVDEYVAQRGLSREMFVLLKEEVREVFRTYIKSEPFIIDSLLNFCRQRELTLAVFKSLDILSKDPENACDKVLKEIDQAVSIGIGADSDGLNFDDLRDLPSLLKQRYSPEKLYKTGIAKFDEACMGGLAPGELHVIQSPPKCGKSTLAANIGAYGLITGKTVFHVSLEISDIDTANKYAVRLTGLSYSEMNNIHSDYYQQRIGVFDKYKPKLFINFWPEGTANALHIRAWISKMRSKFNVKPDILIVDYDDCLLPIRGLRDDLYGNSGEIYKDLIVLANHFKIPILSFAQPKREAWETPNKNELIRSGEISHSAMKVHKAFSISSLNFADDSKIGVLLLDRNRRGESNVKIKMKRELYKGLVIQDE